MVVAVGGRRSVNVLLSHSKFSRVKRRQAVVQSLLCYAKGLKRDGRQCVRFANGYFRKAKSIQGLLLPTIYAPTKPERRLRVIGSSGFRVVLRLVFATFATRLKGASS